MFCLFIFMFFQSFMVVCSLPTKFFFISADYYNYFENNIQAHFTKLPAAIPAPAGDTHINI